MNYSKFSREINKYLQSNNPGVNGLFVEISHNKSKFKVPDLFPYTDNDLILAINEAKLKNENFIDVPPFSDMSELSSELSELYEGMTLVIGSGSLLPRKLNQAIVGTGALIYDSSKINNTVAFGSISVIRGEKSRFPRRLKIKNSMISSVFSSGLVSASTSIITHIESFGLKASNVVIGSGMVSDKASLENNNIILGSPNLLFLENITLNGAHNILAGEMTIFGRQVGDRVNTIDISANYASNFVALGRVVIPKDTLLPTDLDDLDLNDNRDYSPNANFNRINMMIRNLANNNELKLVYADKMRHETSFNLTEMDNNTLDNENSLDFS